jgi:hypothetical protein
VQSVKEVSKSFPRWMNFHCKPCENKKAYGTDNDQSNYTFYKEIQNHLVIKGVYMSVINMIQLREMDENISFWQSIGQD